MTPLDYYRRDLRCKEFYHDPVQQRAVDHLQHLYESLQRSGKRKNQWWTQARIRWLGGKVEPVRGLYLWGGVGRGKTYLVDTFHESLPFREKQRVHFHRFMQQVHYQLKGLKKRQDPLVMVADRLAQATRILCFDEFHVSDIADAMLLGRLLDALFHRGVTLVSTSNVAPDDLYRHGLQRERFLPAIALIKQYQQTLHLSSEQDYRLRVQPKSEIYYVPLNKGADQYLKEHFLRLSQGAVENFKPLWVEHRSIDTVRNSVQVVWFTFGALCGGPRSTADYIQIARTFGTVLLSDIPQMGEEQNDKAMRFIHLIDELYDRSVTLILSAEVQPAELYNGDRLAFPFQRVVSRLEEMRSKDYLQRPHQP